MKTTDQLYEELRAAIGNGNESMTHEDALEEVRALQAQQPAPSAAVALSDDLRDGLVAISEAIADQDDRAAQAMLREILAAPQPTPTAQADSQPVVDRARIREIFMAHGFTVKEGQTDLKQYVYDAADALLRAARATADSVTAPAVASEPIAYLYDDGSWTPAKTEEGRKLNDWMISAGSPKIGVHLASTAQPTPLTTLAQATQAGNQQEARPCHVFTVRKAGGLTEWEPTTMALALPDGAHALYTLPQPSPHAHADSVTAPMRQGKWTWVPVEPSTAMLVAGNHGRPGDFSALKVWEDMLGALERSFDYTRPVDPPSTNPPAQAAGRGGAAD